MRRRLPDGFHRAGTKWRMVSDNPATPCARAMRGIPASVGFERARWANRCARRDRLGPMAWSFVGSWRGVRLRPSPSQAREATVFSFKRRDAPKHVVYGRVSRASFCANLSFPTRFCAQVSAGNRQNPSAPGDLQPAEYGFVTVVTDVAFGLVLVVRTGASSAMVSGLSLGGLTKARSRHWRRGSPPRIVLPRA